MSEFPKKRRVKRKVGESTAPESYAAFVGDLKKRISEARLRAALSVNRELVLLYWGIGRDILSRQEREGWGSKVIDRLSADLGQAFPEMTGLSARNLNYLGCTPCRRPTALVTAPGANASATISDFCSSVQRRRRSGP